MKWFRYMVDRRLSKSEAADYAFRRPGCPVCRFAMRRIAIRQIAEPYRWQPSGWICGDCNIIDIGDEYE